MIGPCQSFTHRAPTERAIIVIVLVQLVSFVKVSVYQRRDGHSCFTPERGTRVFESLRPGSRALKHIRNRSWTRTPSWSLETVDSQHDDLNKGEFGHAATARDSDFYVPLHMVFIMAGLLLNGYTTGKRWGSRQSGCYRYNRTTTGSAGRMLFFWDAPMVTEGLVQTYTLVGPDAPTH